MLKYFGCLHNNGLELLLISSGTSSDHHALPIDILISEMCCQKNT
jgi:hypothetical protein